MDRRSAAIPATTVRSSQSDSTRNRRQPILAILLAVAAAGQFESRAASAESASGRTEHAYRATAHADLLENHQRGTQQALRVREDLERDRLWVLTLEHVFVYDTKKRKPLGRIRLPNWPIADFMCPPDMVLGRDGTVFVSNNVQPRLLQIGPSGFRTREHQLRLASDKQWEIGFGALAFGPDGTLFGLSALAGSLFRIDLASGTANEIRRSAHAKDNCALANG